MSPTSRRRRGEPPLDDLAATHGTTVSEASDHVPDEPEWLRDTAAGSDLGVDPTAAPPPPPDPVVIAARRAAREAEIVRALNPEQARAVTTTEGPLLILAGAGSGKTRVLAHRIAYLVGVKGVAPWRILAVTFTNRAAAELRERIISLVGEGGRDVQAGTFHALCARVLRQEGEAIGISRRFVIYDTDDQQALMKQVLREQDLPLTGEFRPSAVLGAICRAKNEMLDPAFLSENAANHRERTIARLAARYQERLRARGRPRLRRPAARSRPAVPGGPGRPRQVSGTMALPPRRRVPGHQPGAIPVGPRAGGATPQPVRRRR